MDLVNEGIRVSIFKTASAAVSFIGIAIFTRLISSSDLGVFFQFQAVLALVAVFTNLALSDAVEKRISEGELAANYLTSGIVIKFVVLALAIGAILLNSKLVATYLGEGLVALFVFGLVLREFSTLVVRILSGEMKVSIAYFLKLLEQVGWLVCGLLLVEQMSGGRALIYGLLLGQGLVIIGGIVYISTPVGRLTRNATSSLIEYAKYHSVSLFSGVIFNWTDVFLIGVFLTNHDVSVYVIAWKVSQISIIMNRSIAVTIFPQISRWDRGQLTARIDHLFSDAIMSAAIITLPAVAGIIALRGSILTEVFSETYLIAADVLVLLMIGVLFQSIYAISVQFVHGVDRPDLGAVITTVATLLNVILNLVLIPRYGTVGAAAATSLSYGVMATLYAATVYLLQDISIPYMELGWITVASVLMGGFASRLAKTIRVDSVLMLGFVITISGALFFAIGGVHPDTRNRFRTVIDSLR